MCIFIRMMLADLTREVHKEFCKFDSQPDALRRLVRARFQRLKWEDGPTANRKHNFLDGGDAEGGAVDDLDPNIRAELAILARSSAVTDCQLKCFKLVANPLRTA